jgi:hypothetical protein
MLAARCTHIAAASDGATMDAKQRASRMHARAASTLVVAVLLLLLADGCCDSICKPNRPPHTAVCSRLDGSPPTAMVGSPLLLHALIWCVQEPDLILL